MEDLPAFLGRGGGGGIEGSLGELIILGVDILANLGLSKKSDLEGSEID